MTQTSWKTRLAWACGLIVILTAAAWGAQKIIKIYMTDNPKLKQMTEHTLPNGSKVHMFAMSMKDGIEIKSEGNKLTDQEREKLTWDVISKIRHGKAQLLGTKKEKDGSETYTYQVRLDDGKEVVYRTKEFRPGLFYDFTEKILTKIGRDEKSDEIYLMYLKVVRDGSATEFSISDGSKWGHHPYCEIPTLIEQGKGKLNTILELKGGTKYYLYEIVLSSGERVFYGSKDKPLSTIKAIEDREKNVLSIKYGDNTTHFSIGKPSNKTDGCEGNSDDTVWIRADGKKTTGKLHMRARKK